MKKEDLKLLQDISKMPKDNGYVRVDVFLNGYNFKPGAKSIIL